MMNDILRARDLEYLEAIRYYKLIHERLTREELLRLAYEEIEDYSDNDLWNLIDMGNIPVEKLKRLAGI